MSPVQLILGLALAFAPSLLLVAVIGVWILSNTRRKVREPLSEKLLRAPGESLRCRLEKFNDRFLFLVIGLIFYGPACAMLFLMYYVWRQNSPHILMEMIVLGVLAVITTVIIAHRTMVLLRRHVNDTLGFRGERAVGEELNTLMQDGCLVFHDVPGEGDWNVDHVVVAPSGVYAIETKTRRKSATQGGRKDYEIIYDGKTLQLPTWTDTRILEQTKANARWLAKHLSKALAEEIKVTPILTFPGWFITSQVKPSGFELRVLNHKQIRSVIVDGSPPKIDDKRLKQIGHQLDLRCRDVEF